MHVCLVSCIFGYCRSRALGGGVLGAVGGEAVAGRPRGQGPCMVSEDCSVEARHRKIKYLCIVGVVGTECSEDNKAQRYGDDVCIDKTLRVVSVLLAMENTFFIL